VFNLKHSQQADFQHYHPLPIIWAKYSSLMR
jgi:hypothetical protein